MVWISLSLVSEIAMIGTVGESCGYCCSLLGGLRSRVWKSGRVEIGWDWGWDGFIGNERCIWGGDGFVGLCLGMGLRSFVEYATSSDQDGMNKCFLILLEGL